MNSMIEQMLLQHEKATVEDRKNSIKEVVQEIVLFPSCGTRRRWMRGVQNSSRI